MKHFLIVLLAVHCIGANAGNLVANPDFDTNVNWDWTPNGSGSGPLPLDMTTVDPSAPSAHIVTDATTGGTARSQCILISGPQNVDLIVNGKVNAGSVEVRLEEFGTDDCTFSRTQVTTVDFTSAAWQQLSQSNLALISGTQSVQIWLVGPTSTDANIDHVQLGLSGTLPVTLQSFQVD